MTFNFDIETNKKGTHSIKWEFLFENGRPIYGDHADPKHGSERILPLWVADMDFRCAPPIIEAIQKRAEQGVLGYCSPADSYYEAVVEWVSRRYGWQIERDWIVITPGVVPAINMLIQSLLQPGDKVLVQPPVYHPFFSAVKNNGCELVENALVYEEGHFDSAQHRRYHMDFDDLAEKAADTAVKMAILCSPHNPVGRVWTEEELTRFGEICLDNDVLVVSDEIHCDLIYSGHKFTSYATISQRFAQNSIICTAPSKTFNIAGLKTSNIIIIDEALRTKFAKGILRNGLMGAHTFGVVATEAAYRHGEPWLEAVMAYIEENYRFMSDYMEEHLPQLHIVKPEGTYLVWVDCSALNLSPDARKKLLMQEAHVFLNEGKVFGVEGENFERINLACPRSILAEALERIRTAVATLEPTL